MTVIVPTRCRPDTLEKCLRTVVDQNFDGLSILVSDNASGDHTPEVVAGFRDPRISYFDTGRRLSMSHNYEFALSKVARQDTWVTILGDDDGLLPRALKRLREVVAQSRVAAVRSNVCTYTWPSVNGGEFGRLGVPLGSRVDRRKSTRYIERVMECRSIYAELPMLYNGGFVHMSVIASVRERLGGSFYRSLNPDVFSAFAVAAAVDEYAFCEEPLAINGLSRHSTGLSYAANPNTTSAPAKQFNSEGNIPYHQDIPLMSDGWVPLGQPLVFEAFLQSASLRAEGSTRRHQRQLELTFATIPAQNIERYEQWGRAFAEKHGLDFDAARAAGMSERRWRRLAAAVEAARAATTIYSVGSAEVPIRDVHEASVVAAAIRRTVQGPWANVPHLAQRAVKKLRAKVR